MKKSTCPPTYIPDAIIKSKMGDSLSSGSFSVIILQKINPAMSRPTIAITAYDDISVPNISIKGYIIYL
jgi:hypothetical protein